jgi:hypothetical protein
METDTVVLNRQALLLFNFLANKKQNDRRIGDLTIGDFFELCEILEESKNAAN